MTKTFLRRCISLMLTLCIFCSVFTSTCLNISAADTTGISVDIVSFIRGPQEDLRASELLEARVTGYHGNVRELTYEWINELGTYLYIYNSHNMYHINNTDGELEIYNNNVSSSSNMVGRSFKDKVAKQGFCWASVYGAYSSAYSALEGKITVIVKDKDGKELCSDTHIADASRTGFFLNYRYKYTGIVPYSIEDDLDDVTIGIFEGDERNVKDLLGESAILHITCEESTVENGVIRNGDDHIQLYKKTDGDYYIKGTDAPEDNDINPSGDASVNLTIKKANCKFHKNTSGTATTTVFVFKKPDTATTAYTLTLTGNLDKRCEYFIDGRKGVEQTDGTILFDGLTPNTQYVVEVKAKYPDESNNTRYAYAYVYDTTLPVYTGTVEVYLNGTYDSATHTASGTKVNIEAVTNNTDIYVKEENSTKYIKLDNTQTGTYNTVLDNGSYKLYYKENDESSKIDEQMLTIHNSNRTRYLFYNSVEYKSDGELLDTQYYVSDSSVNVYDKIPVKEGYAFTGWKIENDDSGKLYQPNELLTSNISEPYVLIAQWVKGVDVYVNFEIDHYGKNEGHYTDSDRYNVDFDLMARNSNTGDYADVFPAPYSIIYNGESEFVSDHFTVENAVVPEESDKTYYKAKAPILVNTPKGQEFSIEVIKSGYEIIEVTTTTDETTGDVTVNVKLRFDPKNADLNFTVELDQDSIDLIKNHPDYKPKAAHVKVLSWYTSDYNGKDHTLEKNNWHHISQHHDTFVTVNFDEGKTSASGSYPVWMHNNSKSEYYHYRIKVVSYVLQDDTIVYTEDVNDAKDVEYITTDDRYVATISVTDSDNDKDNIPDINYTNLLGAHFKDETGTQDGDLLATIHINTHKVTFKPNSGLLLGSNEDKELEKQIEVPDLSQYIPTRDGGYVFDGWYIYENDKMTDKTVNSGDDLFDDITLIAKWKDPLTVKGLISVPGYYHLNNNTDEVRIIDSNDRTHHVTVYLQKILPNGYTETINSQKVAIAYNDNAHDPVELPMGTSNYEFTGVPDDGHQYRILIQNPNYVDKYQNEPDSLSDSLKFDYSKYYVENSDKKSFIAVFEPENADEKNNPLEAEVNVFMEFTPTPFPLKYTVDAKAIGEGFRPSNAEVAILYKNDPNELNPQKWETISDMKKDGDVIGKVTDIPANGIGEDSYDAWMNHADGHTLYEYSLLLDEYTAAGDNAKTTFDIHSAPFYAYYNGSARYSPLNGQSQPLSITLVPKQYEVTFNIGFVETDTDYVMGMVPYEDENLVYTTLHTWSYNTDISKVAPVRPGYKFLGWYDKDPAKSSDAKQITQIDASVATNTTVYANWKEAMTVTFHSNNPDIDYQIFRTYYEADVELPEGENIDHLTKENKVKLFYDIPEFKYMEHNGYIFKGWYLDPESDERPISFDDVYKQTTHIYAHWIKTGTVEKEEADTKITQYDTEYPGFDLIGVQVRDVVKDDISHGGEANTGLRFVTVLSEDVYSQINNLSSNNSGGAEYGYAFAKTNTAKKYYDDAGKPEKYELQYNGTNVNGIDTSTDFKYVKNAKCSVYPDHYKGEKYRLYTTVVTYSGDENKFNTDHAAPLLARSYIRYTDANGLLRTHYNNYTGTNVFSGCSASFDDALKLMEQNNK
ncbi:MAG: InlB B-repeat-containing protein [Ruminococcus sp.]|nr:InlB B-repeat-containing protein [Ruminococcus sp.]